MATTVSLKPNAVEISGSTSGTTTLQATAVAGTTTLTLPAATDTLVGKATTDTLTNKTLGAFTLAGTVAGGGNQLNNVIIGASTPLAGSFTTLSATQITESTGAAWTAYTPTLAVDTGTITTSITNARYRQLGKTLFISLSITFTVTSGSPTEFRVTFPGGQVAPNNNQYTPVYMTFNSTAILGLARATVNAYGLQITPSNGLAYLGNCAIFVNTVFELN